MEKRTNLTHGKRVVITGASAGIGRASAIEFAKEGAVLCLIARDRDRLESAKKEALDAGASAVDIICSDVADYDALNSAAQAFFARRGGVDVWVNNAMASVFARFEDIEAEEFKRVTEVVYLGSAWGAKIALKKMEEQGYGRIVFVGSALAYRGIPLQSAYCGAKHAVQGLFDSLRAELLHRKSPVSIGMVQLPAVNTPQFNWSRNKMTKDSRPVPPIFQPEVAARSIVWMSKRKKRELLVGLSSVIAVWGNKLFPKLGDWYLAKTAFKSQQTDKHLRRPDHDNLFKAPSGDFGAHGSFDDQAKARSYELWAAQHKKSAAAIGFAIFGLVYSLLR